MSRSTTSTQSNQRPMAVLAGTTGLLTAAFCTAEWMSSPQVAAQLWPSDIHSEVVGLLGGEMTIGVGGHPQTSLDLMPILLRIIGVVVVAAVVAGVVNRSVRRSELVELLLMRTGAVGLAAGVVWFVQLFAVELLRQGVLPPVILMLAGCALFSCLSVCFKPTAGEGSSRVAIVVLLAMTFLWIVLSFRLNERLHANLMIPHGDSAMYEEHLWNVWHGKGFRSYLDQGLFLGEHIQVIHLLLLPAHVLWPSHLTLELAESFALGSCTIPLFLMVRRRTGSDWAACLLAISWLFYFPMHFLDIAIDQKTFRPISLGLPFLFWMVHAAETQRYRWAWLCLLIALSAKEDMALITAPLAGVIAWQATRPGGAGRGLRNWGMAASGFSVAWLMLTVLVVIPAFRSGNVVHYSRYFGELGSSPGELVRTALTSPTLVLAQVFSIRTLFYAVVFLAPVACLAVRRPLQLLGGSLTFLMLSLIQLGNGPDAGGLPPIPFHHFHAPLLPVLFWSTLCAVALCGSRHAIRRFLLPSSPAAAALLVFCCCLTTGLTGSLMPMGATHWSDASGFGRHALYDLRQDVAAEQRLLERAAMADKVVELIPQSARVASTDYIHTRLTHCERSYDYSGYQRAVNEKGKRVPADCEYIVIDTGHHYSEIHNSDEVPELTESDDWELLPDETNGFFLILRRRIIGD